MKKEDEKFDELLKTTLSQDQSEAPLNQNFTDRVMKTVVAHHAVKQSKGFSGRQFLYAALGLLACFSIVATIIILWQTGNLSQLAVAAGELLRPVLNLLPFSISPWMLIVFALHVFLSRALFTIYLLNRQRKRRRMSW